MRQRYGGNMAESTAEAMKKNMTDKIYGKR